MNLDTLRAICKGTKVGRLQPFVVPLDEAMTEFCIDTPARQAAFLAQIAHESGCFYYTREIASGDAYEGRADLGNTEPGDGRKFRGRGLMQVTGRDAYGQCSMALYGDERLLDTPELLEQYDNACRSACWFWQSRDLNELADAGDFRRITLKINGGLTHYGERQLLWERAKAALKTA